MERFQGVLRHLKLIGNFRCGIFVHVGFALPIYSRASRCSLLPLQNCHEIASPDLQMADVSHAGGCGSESLTRFPNSGR